MKPNLSTVLVYAEEAAQRAEQAAFSFEGAMCRLWINSPEWREARDARDMRMNEASAIRDAMQQCRVGNY